MAALAHSTPAPAVRGGPVTRAVAAMRGGPQQDEHRGLGGIILNGGPVFFDTNRYPRGGDSIVVVFGDGRIEVATMPGARNAHSPNLLMIEVDRPYARGMRVCAEQAMLVGAVTAQLA